MYGKDYNPDGEIFLTTLAIGYWLSWYDNCYERLGSLDEEDRDCPEAIMDNPEEFIGWIKSKQNKTMQRIKGVKGNGSGSKR
ncbi:MAG: hypothetical protein PHN69_02405 [Candidatus Pacebacteria bacterium]|nr:hypothetical protein [Candidatus Paceibacterota bacterium]